MNDLWLVRPSFAQSNCDLVDGRNLERDSESAGYDNFRGKRRADKALGAAPEAGGAYSGSIRLTPTDGAVL